MRMATRRMFRAHAANVIQAKWKMHSTKKYVRGINLRHGVEIVNTRDPITMEDMIPGLPYFHIVTDNGAVYQYDAQALAHYFEQTATWNEPFTNKRLNVVEIRRLQRFLKTYHKNCPNASNLVEKFKDPGYRMAEQFREQALNDFDDLCGDLLREMLTMADDDCETTTFFRQQCGDRIFPEFDAYFSQMMSNENFAMTCILKYITICKGDPFHQRQMNRKSIQILDYLFGKVIFYIR